VMSIDVRPNILYLPLLATPAGAMAFKNLTNRSGQSTPDSSQLHVARAGSPADERQRTLFGAFCEGKTGSAISRPLGGRASASVEQRGNAFFLGDAGDRL